MTSTLVKVTRRPRLQWKQPSTNLRKRRNAYIQSRRTKVRRSQRTGPKERLRTATRQEGCRPILSSSTRRPNALVKSTQNHPRERLRLLLLRQAGSQPALRLSQAKDMEEAGVLTTLTGRTPNTRRRGASNGEATPTTTPLLSMTLGVGRATCPSHMAINRRALTPHHFMYLPKSRLETTLKSSNKLRHQASTTGTSTPLVMVFNK
jgi:hypothetical protein